MDLRARAALLDASKTEVVQKSGRPSFRTPSFTLMEPESEGWGAPFSMFKALFFLGVCFGIDHRGTNRKIDMVNFS